MFIQTKLVLNVYWLNFFVFPNQQWIVSILGTTWGMKMKYFLNINFIICAVYALGYMQFS